MSIFEPSVNELVRADHAYRKFLELLDFEQLCKQLADIRSDLGRSGYYIRQGFATLLLQWIENLSDRHMKMFFLK